MTEVIRVRRQRSPNFRGSPRTGYSSSARGLLGGVTGAMQRLRHPTAIAALGVASAILLGLAADCLGLQQFDWTPFAVVSVWVGLRREAWAASTLVVVGGLLLVARSGLGPSLLAQEAPGAVAVVCLFSLVVRSRYKALRFGRGVMLVVGLGILLIGVTAISTGLDSLFKATGVALLWTSVVLVATALSPKDRRALATVAVVAGVGEAVIAFGESLLQWNWWRELFALGPNGDVYVARPNRILGSWTSRAQATTGYPIPLAVFLSIALLASTFRGSARRWTRAIVIVLLGVAILLTGSRSAFAFCGVALAVGLAAQARKRLPRRSALILSATVLGGAFATVAGFLIRSATIGDFSLLHRSGVIGSSLELFQLPLAQVLLGNGYNAAQRLQAAGMLRVDTAAVVDNAYVTQFANTGLIGLALLVFILAFGIARGGRVVRPLVLCVAIAMFSFDLQYWHLLTFILLVAVGSRRSAKHSSGIRQRVTELAHRCLSASGERRVMSRMIERRGRGKVRAASFDSIDSAKKVYSRRGAA